MVKIEKKHLGKFKSIFILYIKLCLDFFFPIGVVSFSQFIACENEVRFRQFIAYENEINWII